jgi:hypothetical protein
MELVDATYDAGGRCDADCKLELSAAALATAVGVGCA